MSTIYVCEYRNSTPRVALCQIIGETPKTFKVKIIEQLMTDHAYCGRTISKSSAIYFELRLDALEWAAEMYRARGNALRKQAQAALDAATGIEALLAVGAVCSHCDNTGWVTTYDIVPYGSTTARMPTSEPCLYCDKGREIIKAIERGEEVEP